MANPKNKIQRVMKEYKEGKLHSGSKKGSIVKNKNQAIAIAMNYSHPSKSKSLKKK